MASSLFVVVMIMVKWTKLVLRDIINLIIG